MPQLSITCPVIHAQRPMSPGVLSTTSYNRITKAAHKAMEEGRGVTSASGLSAWAAIAWCEHHHYGFVLTAAPDGKGYHVQRGDKWE